MIAQFHSHSHRLQKWFCGLLLMTFLGINLNNAAAKTPTYESLNLPERYSVAPLPSWFKPLPVASESEFHKGEDRYLSRQTAVRVDAKGWGHVVTHAVMEIGSKDHPWLKGPNADMEPIVFDASEQALVLHTLKVHRNGKVMDYTRSARPDIRGQEEPYFSPDELTARYARFQLPRLRTGDRVEWAYSTVTYQLSSPYRFSSQVFWQAPDSQGLTYPVVLERQLFQWSSERPHRPVEIQQDDLAHSLARQWVREEVDLRGWKQVSWTAERVAPMPVESSSIGHVPNDTLLHDQVGITEFEEGRNVADDFSESYLAAPAPSSAAYLALLDQIRREPGPSRQAAAALRWVQKNIAFHVDQRPTPMPADDVLAVGRGDCKDVSMLLWQLMRSLGIESEIASLNTRMGRWPAKQGSLAYFDHVVAVVWIDAKPYVLDATLMDGMLAQQPMSLEHMGNHYANYDLRISHGPRKGYLRIPPSANIDDRTRRIEQRTEVGADGKSLTITTSLTFTGAMADYWRGAYTGVDEEGRRKLFMAQMKDMDPKDKWLDPLGIEDDVVNNRMTLRARTQFGTTLRKSPEGHFMVGFALQPLFDLITDPSGSQTRVNPLRLPFDVEARAIATHTLVLPKGWTVHEPPRLETVEHPAMRVEYARKTEAKPEGTEVVDTLELNLLSDRVLPMDFPAYRLAVDKALRLTSDIRFGP